MACGCRKNSFGANRSSSGPRQQAALKPVANATKNIVMPPKNMQTIAQTTSQTPPAPRSASGAYNEKRKIQQVRRDAIRKAFGK